MNNGERALWQAARPHVVARYVGELGFVLGLMTLVPTAGAVIFGEYRLIAPYALIVAGLLGLGVLARRAPPPAELQHNEALAITALAFLLSALILALPLVWQGLPWLDALFEAVSGITTTGLSTLDSLADQPRTFLLARAWMQWVGGLGFVVLSLALILDSAAAARQLAAPGLEPSDMAAGLRAHARRVLLVYLALSGVGCVALLLLGSSIFDAVVHTFAAVSTGGFAPHDGSLDGLHRPLAAAVMALSLAGAIALPLYFELARRRWRYLLDDAETRALVVIVAVLAVLLIVTSTRSGVAAVDLALLAVSAQSTAGFSTFAPAILPDDAKALLVLSMLTGGAQGSTAGGIKLLHILILLRLVQWLVARTRLPQHAVSAPSFSGRPLEAGEIARAAALLMLFAGVVVLSWLAFLVRGYPPLDALFEVASATGTVGLSSGITQSGLEPFLKGVLCLDMYLGRLEIFAVLVALSPRTWIGRQMS